MLTVAENDDELNAHIQKARNSLKQFQFDTAFLHFDSALYVAEASDNKTAEAYILRLRGRAFIISGKDELALENLAKAIRLSKKLKNDTILAMAYLNVAYVVRDKGMPDSAMVLYNKALQLY